MITLLISRYFTNPFYVLCVVILVAFGSYVFVENAQLKPQIASDFFFSKTSQIYLNNVRIDKKFIVANSIIVSVPAQNIKDKNYLKFIANLTSELKKIKGVKSAQSLTKGPSTPEHGIQNPLWSRLLDTKGGKSSSIICFVEEKYMKGIVLQLEALQRRFSTPTYPIHISGVPFIIEKMRVMLEKDMKTFLAGAVAVSSAVLLLMFWSLFVTVGCALSALFAASMTLLLQQYMGVSVGVLTANLGAIVYVLTTSHIIFLTSNWRNDLNKNKNRRIASTVTTTFPASFWAMLTTFCGFLSLVFVEAEPLRQLGLGGTVGTIVAFLSAYILFPIFLRFSKIHKEKLEIRKNSFLPLPLWLGMPLAIFLVVVSGYFGLREFKNINTDPSLLSYFKKNTNLYKGLEHIDRQGGSNPLNFVISSKKHKKLSNKESFQALKALQYDLESHPTVGSVLSLAVLMEETQKHWLARWLPWGSVLNILSKDQYDKVARGFITKDFSQALFIIRMKEGVGIKDRSRVIRQLMAKPGLYNLNLDIVGGTYYLQSELSKKVESSMKTGVIYLIILFCAIILLVSFSLVSTLFASVSIVSLVAAMVAVIGHFKIPFDIISSPAINICLGIAVDGMIHLVMDVRRHSGSRFRRINQQAWRVALGRQAWPTFISALAVACGFSVFAISEFPPSQRFGLEIVFGSLVAMVLTLLVLPQVGFLFARKDKPSPYELMPMPELKTVKPVVLEVKS